LTQSTTSGTPYASAALVYRQRGWTGVLPADLNGKIGHVPAGYSGGHDVDPDDEQVQRWVDGLGGHNVALRLPDDPEFAVIGIDVDAYGDKTGDETVEYAANQFGAGDLPPSWSSTARGPGQPSRIWFFRVPPGRRWRSDLGRGSAVEIIQRGHRWARVWPSTNHRLLGRSGVDPTYRWYAPDGTVNALPPRPEDLTELPESWVKLLELADGEPATHLRPARTGEESESRGNFAGLDGPALDVDGQPVDPERLLREGAPVGSQQTELFRYMCSLRARGLHREEMITLGMCLIQQFRNEDGRDPWQASDVIDVVDHVRREYAPGGSQLSPGLQAVADRIAAGGTVTVEEPSLVEESATDLGNSLRFARLFAERARYAEDLQRWYVWDERRWVPDVAGLLVVDKTKHVIDDLRRQAFLDEDHRDEWLRWANASEALNRRKAMVDGARSEPGLRTTSEAFDRDPDLLVVRNGTIDLRTCRLRESRPEDLNSQLAEVEFDVDATHRRWSEHVELVCKNDPQLVRYLARAVGYSLTGNVGARAFFFLEGTGSNGKNAFIEPIMQLLGSYAQTASPALLTGSDEQHPALLADLLGARLIFVDETRRGRALNVERVKALTGSKLIKAAFKHKDYFEFEAKFKLWIAGNGTPTVQDDSDGVWTRLHRVVCHGKVNPAARVDRYGDVLYREEASGILNWALRGLTDWRTGGLAVPESVRAAVEEYRHDENVERQFFDEQVEVTGDPADRLTTADLYLMYDAWCDASGVRRFDRKNKVHLARSVVGFELPGITPAEWKDGTRKVRGFGGVRWQVGTGEQGG
jgi:P4 family phage/plasmid primase-like protien